MSRIHIVTDSAARFVNAHTLAQNPITIVPNRLILDGKVYREAVDISPEDAIKLIGQQPTAPKITPPTTEEYMQTYVRLMRDNDAIISIHSSRELSNSWLNAKTAAQQVMGQCPIVVIDSQTLCAAQGMLIQVAARAAAQGDALDDVVRQVRGAIDRIYAIYYLDSIDFLRHNRIMSTSHFILGTMLGIKPLMTIEDGVLVPIEKVKTRNQAIERLVEFATEFAHIEDIVILQSRPRFNDQIRALQDRLALEFPGQHFPYTVYSASLACLIGAHATGIVILENETDEFNYEFQDD